jgi:hypothetical protein
VTRELARCQASTHFEWSGARLAPDDVPDALALEPDAARRRELSARWFDLLRACNDLRAARLDTLNEAARALNFNSYFSLRSGTAVETSLESLSAAAENFLARTAAVYDTTLFEWAARHLPPEYARAPVHADSLFLLRLSHLDPFFPASELRGTYEATMAGFGIRVGQQHNLSVETTGHKSTETTAHELRRGRASCYALNPPEDVRLVYGDTGGASLYQTFFAAAGGAQAFAWVSRDLAARYPELVHAPEETTRAGFRLLFGDLLADAAWLGAYRNVRPSSAGEIARSFAFVELQRTRRACARLQQQRILAQASDPRDAQLAEGYATALEEATSFRTHPSLYLRDLISGDSLEARESASLQPAVYLRARLFATALGEYFRTRYGHRWWAARRAADELIDLWNTGSRYTVEELATLAGLGELNFDLLADTTEAALRGE